MRIASHYFSTSPAHAQDAEQAAIPSVQPADAECPVCKWPVEVHDSGEACKAAPPPVQPAPSSGLAPCPFCSHTTAPKPWTYREMVGEDYWDDGNADSFAVVCDAEKPDGPGGCGGSGGFFPTEASAIAAWNRRAAPAAPSAPVGDGAATQPAGEEAHPDIAKLRSAVNLALTYFGMDEDESNREVFKALREAYAHAASLPEHIDRIATVFGSLRKMAEALDIDVGYLSRLRSGEKADPSDEILATLGLRRTVTYTKVRTSPYEATPLIPRTRSA